MISKAKGTCERNQGSFLWTRAQRIGVAWTLNKVVLGNSLREDVWKKIIYFRALPKKGGIGLLFFFTQQYICVFLVIFVIKITIITITLQP